MLVSSRAVAKERILSLCYTGNQVEEIFRIGKGEGKMLPNGKVGRPVCADSGVQCAGLAFDVRRRRRNINFMTLKYMGEDDRMKLEKVSCRGHIEELQGEVMRFLSGNEVDHE